MFCTEKRTDTFLLGILTVYGCTANPDFTNASSTLYQSIGPRAAAIVRNIADVNLTVNVEQKAATFIGYRCVRFEIFRLENAEITLQLVRDFKKQYWSTHAHLASSIYETW